MAGVVDPIALVAPDGAPTAEARYRRQLPPEILAWLYESMVVTRELDTEFVNLQRQGELALYASCRGQEAAQVGAAACLRKTDWLFPQYRELGAFLVRGSPRLSWALYGVAGGMAGSGSPTNAARRSRFRSAPRACTLSVPRWQPSASARTV